MDEVMDITPWNFRGSWKKCSDLIKNNWILVIIDLYHYFRVFLPSKAILSQNINFVSLNLW